MSSQTRQKKIQEDPPQGKRSAPFWPGLWREGQYNFHYFSAAGFTGSVGWALEGGGYVARFEKWQANKRYDSIDKAKAAVEKIARTKCDQLMTCLMTGEKLP